MRTASSSTASIAPLRNSRPLSELQRAIDRVQQRHRSPTRRCPSGLVALDRVLGGGFVRGAVHELVARPECAPSLSLALWMASRALRQRDGQELCHNDPVREDRWVLMVDSNHDFFPPAAIALGIPPDRLLVARPSTALDAQWVCEQALRCRALAALIAPMNRMNPTASRRLQLAAESGQTLGFLLRSCHDRAHTFCGTRLRIEIAPQAVMNTPLIKQLHITIIKQIGGANGSHIAVNTQTPLVQASPEADITAVRDAI